MISEAAGAGVIRQDVQQAIESEVRYRLGEGDAPGALSRWQKELLLLVIQTVKANACLSQLHARAAVKAGATLAQVLQVVQYVELTGMVKWVMDGYIRMRENFVKPDPLGAVPKKLMELAIIAADIVQAHPWGAVRHTQRFIKDGGTVPELIEAVALAMIEDGVQHYKTCGREVIEAAEHILSA